MQGECPHCHKKIDHVDAEAYTTGELNSEEDIVDVRTEWIAFTCPECDEEIAEGVTGTGEICRIVWGKNSS